MKEKTQLEKSHSKSSNALLTLLCLLTSLAFALLFVSASYYLMTEEVLGLVVMIASGVVTLLGVAGLLMFKR